MKFKEFEIKLQQFLDQRDLSSAERLLDQVDWEDRSACVDLLAAYQQILTTVPSLYGDFPLNSPTEDVLADPFASAVLSKIGDAENADFDTVSLKERVSSNSVSTPSPPDYRLDSKQMVWLAFLAGCFLLMMIPAWQLISSNSETATTEDNLSNPVISPSSTELVSDSAIKPELVDPVKLDSSVTLESYPSLSQYQKNWEQLAISFTSTSDNESLEYAAAEPWIEGVSSRLRPVTDSVGSAFSVIRMSTIPDDTQEDANQKPQAYKHPRITNCSYV